MSRLFRRAVPRLTEEAPRRVLTAAQPQGRAPALTLEPSARKDRPAEPQTQPAGPERESR